ncbi:MAG: lysine--tRNA ligase [Acidobacteria bacterium 37-71-11]|nr:MAG: lysine--tRNA ligase [Acidobacteria bacterium 37-71-11]
MRRFGVSTGARGGDVEPLETLRAYRRGKLEELRRRGVDPFPPRFPVDGRVSEVVARFAGHDAAALEAASARVRVGGRVTAIRTHGKAAFLDLADGDARIQAYLKRDQLGDAAFALLETLDLGDFWGVEGALFRTRTGELTVRAETVTVLAKALQPWPEKWHGLTDRELRARQRYLDLATNPGSRKVFLARAATVRAIRSFLDARGFIEVETPMMQPIPGGASARPFVTHHNTLDMDLFLRIAPELYLKRLVVGGFERVYEINRNFRNEGISTHHNPEFTMLEFYWAYAGYEDLMALTEEMVAGIAETVSGTVELPWGGKTISLARPWKRLAMRDAVLAHSDLAPEDLGERARLEASARRFEIADVARLSSGKLLAELFEATAEASLLDPTFVVDFPADISPLAKRKPGAPDLTERFELYMAGMELANAFTELNDPDDQRGRFEEQVRLGGGVVDEDYVLALEHGMPPTAGEGIGIDRLVMLLTDSHSIRDVILFPLLRPKEG